MVGYLVYYRLSAVSLSSNSSNLLFSACCKKRSRQVWSWSWFYCSLRENSLFGSEGEYLSESQIVSRFHHSIDQMETKLALNFKHGAILFCFHKYEFDCKNMASTCN